MPANPLHWRRTIPHVMDRVIVIWRMEDVIPYENHIDVDDPALEMRRVIQRAFIDLMLTPEGKSAVQTTYGIDELQVVEDAVYAAFAAHVDSSGLQPSPVVTPALACRSIKFKEAVLVFMPVLSYYHCVMGMKKRPTNSPFSFLRGENMIKNVLSFVVLAMLVGRFDDPQRLHARGH